MHLSTISPGRETKTSPFPHSMMKVTENDDLLTLILSILPTKTVVRFKCVSKHWYFLISLPSFSLLHNALSPARLPSAIVFPHPNNASLFHFLSLKNNYTSTPSTSLNRTNHPMNNHTSTPFTSLNFTNDPSGEIEILQSCNGLLLCSSGDPWDGIDTRVFYIYNPATKRFYALPPPDSNPPCRHVSLTTFTKISLAFDPCKSPHYKVLLVTKADGKKNCFKIDIYFSKTREWRRWGDDVEWSSLEVFCEGVYLDGLVYWASKRDGFLCFDVEKECFKIMPALPYFRNGSNTMRYFGESCGKLCLVDVRDLEFDVFEMAKDYSGWVPKFQVDLETRFDFRMEKKNVSLISMSEQDGMCLIIHVPGRILSYNLKSGGIEVIKDGVLGNVERMVPALVKGFGGYQYFESLACV